LIFWAPPGETSPSAGAEFRKRAPLSTLLNKTSGSDSLLDFFGGYRPLMGIHDELLDHESRVRPHWQPLLDALNAFPSSHLQQRFGSADRHLRDSGIVYRVYDTEGGAERQLQLAHVPLVMEPGEWARIVSATRQRATLLDLILRDIYGEQKLITEGLLPAAAIAGNPEFLRPLVGVKPSGDSYLRFFAMDIGRGPDGRWWVLGHRTQAPSGAGYLLENRIALSRALPELYRHLNVRRLAGFFRAFRQSLYDLSRDGRNGVGLLTPGAFNETYFEHAYLARYLGLLLVQGEDLVVADGALFVRTITGLQQIDVLLRRMDASFADPLELETGSRIGVPGLVEALRQRSVAIVNALGSGVAEAPVLLSFLPALSQALLGQDLELPHVATWWCGDQSVRERFADGLEPYVVGPAFGSGLPGLLENGPEAVADMAAEKQQRLGQAISARGMDFVVQEAAQLSTMPMWDGQTLGPRPFVLRVYATWTANGWEVMPGGFCRLSNTPDARAVHLQKGGRVADVWVPSETPVNEGALLVSDPGSTVKLQGPQAELLPAIAAENLFWLGRYIDRAEFCTRLVRALGVRLMEYDAGADGVIGEIAELLFNLGGQARADDGSSNPVAIDANFAARALSDAAAPGSVVSLAANAHRAGAAIRERLSPDAWALLHDFYQNAQNDLPPLAGEAGTVEQCNVLLRRMAAFSGLVHHNMMHTAGWRFVQLGICLERAIGTVRAVRHLGAPERNPGAFEALLGVLDSQITFAARYANVPLRSQVVELVVLEPLNPRSLAYQVGRIEEHVGFLTALGGGDTPMQSNISAQQLVALLQSLGQNDADTYGLDQILANLSSLADATALDFFHHQRRTTGMRRLG